MPEIKSFFDELFSGNFGFPLRVQDLKDFPVFSEYGIGIAHIIRYILIISVIEFGAALIGTKLFVNASRERITTNWADF
jgi:hypothetical protein